MSRKSFTLFLASILALPLVLIIAAYGALRSQLIVKRYLVPYLSEVMGVPISIDHIMIRPFTGISVRGFRYNCGGQSLVCSNDKPVAVQISSLELSYNPSALLSRTFDVTSLHVKQLTVAMRAEPDTTRSKAPGTTETPSSATSDSKPKSEESSFRITLANASIEDSHFVYQDVDGSARYELANIKITASAVNSHGDSEVAMSSRVNVHSKDLALDAQDVSISAVARDSVMFQPTVLDVKGSAGADGHTSLRLDGRLVFNQTPYFLREISLHQGTLKHGVLRALSIPFEPLREFEYEVAGSYAFSEPATISATVVAKKSLFTDSDAHNLANSKISATVTLGAEKTTVPNASLELLDNNIPILKATASGDLALHPFKSPSNLSIHAPFANFATLRALISDISTKKPLGHDTIKNTPSARPSTSSSLNSVTLPLGKLLLVVDKAIVQNQEASPLRIEIHTSSPRVIHRASAEANFIQGGHVAVNLAGSLDDLLSLRTTAKNVNMIPFAVLAAGPGGEIVEGSLTSADINLTARGNDIRRTLNGTAQVKVAKLIIPSTLQQQVPFNILFVPLDALITVFGGTLNMLLPASISSISDGIRQTLDKAGRLGLDKSIVELRFERGKIILQNVDINTKNLPDFTFKGSVSADDRLDLTVFMALMKLNLPLPIAGSLSTPLPDVVYLGPELVRGLGLSVGNIAGSAASLVVGSRDSEEALEGR